MRCPQRPEPSCPARDDGSVAATTNLFTRACPHIELKTDVALGVTIPSRHARGRLARLGPVLDAILANHGYPPLIEKLLAEALALTALLGSLLKEPAGAADHPGADRGRHRRPAGVRLSRRRAARLCPPRPRAAGRGVGRNPALLAVRRGLSGDHLRPAADERALPGDRPAGGRGLAEAAQSYFAQSEQIPSIVRLAAEKRDGRWFAGGLLFQHLPEGEEGRDRLHTRLDHPEWPHVAVLAGSVRPEELTDPELPLDDFVWRLFHEEDEVRTLAAIALRKGCRCDPDYVAR